MTGDAIEVSALSRAAKPRRHGIAGLRREANVGHLGGASMASLARPSSRWHAEIPPTIRRPRQSRSAADRSPFHLVLQPVLTAKRPGAAVNSERRRHQRARDSEEAPAAPARASAAGPHLIVLSAHRLCCGRPPSAWRPTRPTSRRWLTSGSRHDGRTEMHYRRARLPRRPRGHRSTAGYEQRRP